MRSSFFTTNPDKIELTLTLTMTLGEWKQLLQQTVDKWPSSDLKSLIQDMTSHADKHFFPKDP